MYHKQPRLTEPLKQCQWLPKSAADGIAAMASSSAKIAIVYDFKNDEQRDFFVYLKNALENSTKWTKKKCNSADWFRTRTRTCTFTSSSATKTHRSAGDSSGSPTRYERFANVEHQSSVTHGSIDVHLSRLAPRQWTVENLVESVGKGSVHEAQQAAQNLAKSRADVQLNLLSLGDQRKVPSADRPMPANALQFVDHDWLIWLMHFLILG